MPTYEYACPDCGNQFETFQSMKDEPLKKCPTCGKTHLKRLLGTGAGLIFKGSGFYITDYRKNGGGGSSSPSSSSSETKASSGGGESKSSGGASPKTP